MNSLRHKVLAIENDVLAQRLLATALAADSYELLAAATGAEGLRLTALRQPDVILVDLDLPDCSGIDVIRTLREWYKKPIIVLSARDLESDKVCALDNGADDYLTKPFGNGELLARLRVAHRHQIDRIGEATQATIHIGNLVVDRAARRVSRDGADVHLTPTEYKLLIELARNRSKVVTGRQLLHDVWGPTHVESPQYLRIYMRALRHKIEVDPSQPKYLLTHIGVGYRLGE
jgi:two-component system KDP operon response regulator KdpE